MLRVGPGSPRAQIDAEDGVLVTGARPGERVRVEVDLTLCGQAWSCVGEYDADATGRVDTSEAASVAGDYLGVDPFGLFWSAETSGTYDWSDMTPMGVRVRAESADADAEASYERHWLPEGATLRAVTEPGVVGRVHLPSEPRAAPGLVIVSGSGGGLGGPPTGALLTGHGIATLSLAHWRHPGTPDRLRDIDIEVVGRGCDWLRRQPGVADRAPTVLGISRGGELALLAGAYLPHQVGDVVSDVGSAVPWGAFGPDTDVNETAWLLAGEPVPQMREDEHDPDRYLSDPEVVARVEIPIERCSGRVLLLSGADDRMWPSPMLSDIAVRRAERLGVADRVEHVAHADAGHACGAPPGYPIPTGLRHPVDDVYSAFGGTRAGNHAARLVSWRRLLDLLGGGVSAPAW